MPRNNNKIDDVFSHIVEFRLISVLESVENFKYPKNSRYVPRAGPQAFGDSKYLRSFNLKTHFSVQTRLKKFFFEEYYKENYLLIPLKSLPNEE